MDKTKILVVDDYFENIRALSSLIEADDVEILSAQNADDALSLIVNHDFALAMLDVHMPMVNGFELARLIRGVKRFRHLPVIFVTAHQRDQQVIFEGYETGAVDLMFKPLDPHVVRSKVRTFVQLDQQAKALKAQMAHVEQLKIEADSANLAKSQFLANMSHEIRTPLAAVLGFAEVLAQGTSNPQEKEDCVSAIRRNGHLLTSIIDNILDLSKIEAQRLELDHIPFSLQELLKDIEATVSLKASAKGLYLRMTVAKSVARSYISDPLRIKQVLLNIVGNAIKFTDQGGVEISVSSQALDGHEVLSFCVKDTGIGLTTEQKEKLFQPFTQADSSIKRKFGGSGLGLIISKQLAQAMGGDLILHTDGPNKGCEITATFQVEKSDMLKIPEASGPAQPIAAQFLAGKKILVVDDVQDNRSLIQLFLKNSGAALIMASSGQEALNLYPDAQPDLVLMDIQMPELDGYETTRALRALGYEGPIIALTAHALSEEHQKCHSAGCNFVLTKPTSKKDLTATLDNFLN